MQVSISSATMASHHRKGKLCLKLVLKVAAKTAKAAPKATASKVKWRKIYKLTLSSPAIKSRVEGDPYDDCLIHDFGALEEHFYTGDDKCELHSTVALAVKSAWDFASSCLHDLDQKEFRAAFGPSGGEWEHEDDDECDTDSMVSIKPACVH